MTESQFYEAFVTLPDPVGSFHRITDALTGLVATVDPERYGDPTPCGAWDVRALCVHIVSVYEMYARAAEADAPRQDAYDYADLAADFMSWSRRCGVAFGAPGFLESVTDSPLGPTRGDVVVQQVCNETYAHAWDLAVALRRDRHLLTELADPMLASWRAAFAYFGRQDSALMGPEHTVPPGSTGADRIAAFLGREVPPQ